MLTRKGLFAFGLIFALFLVQSNFFKSPALLMAAVVYLGLSGGPSYGFWAGAWAGFLVSLLGTGPLNLEIPMFSLIGFLSGLITRRFFKGTFIVPVVLWGVGLWVFSCVKVVYNLFSF